MSGDDSAKERRSRTVNAKLDLLLVNILRIADEEVSALEDLRGRAIHQG